MRGIDLVASKYVGRTFSHYKGGVYKVTSACFDTTAGEFAVIYHRVAGPYFNEASESGIVFTRTVSEFESSVVVDGIETRRFTHVQARPTVEYVPVSESNVRWKPPGFA